MKENSFYKWFSNILNVLINIFLFFTFLSCLYVVCYAIDESIKIYVFIVLIFISIVTLIIFRNRIKELIKAVLRSISKLNQNKQFIILIVVAILLKIIYTILFNYDISSSGDVISEYLRLVNDFVNNGILINTIGDKYVALTLHLSIFNIFHIPYHVGMFVIILCTVILNYLTFKNILGKDLSFVAGLSYILMPSTTLLSFCPNVEIYIMFYLSLFIFALYKLISLSGLFDTMFYSLLMIFVIFILRSFSFIGYILLFAISLIILLSYTVGNRKYVLTAIIIISILINNVFYYGISYEWRNKEYAYQSVVTGSNIDSDGRFVEDYTKDIVDEYLIENNLNGSHENQEIAYINAIKDNYKNLCSNPEKIIELLISKYYVLWSGDHYSIEMLNNYFKFPNATYYSLLGISELIYIIVIFVGLFLTHKTSDIFINILELVLILTVIVLLIGESSNRLALFMTPFIYIVCLSKLKD